MSYQSIFRYKSGPERKVDTVFIGQKKYYDSFKQSMQKAAKFYEPFNKASTFIENNEYGEALKELNESLKNARGNFHKGMVYGQMQMIYNKQGNLQKELEAIELWFSTAGENANHPEFERRAAEIRQQLAATKKVPGTK